jgi:hypothetical protein
MGDQRPSAGFGWRLYTLWRTQLLATFAVFIVTFVILAVPPTGFSAGLGLAAVGILGWNAYWFLLRGVHQLEVRDGTLHWATPLRSGLVPVAEVQAIRPWLGLLHVIRTQRGNLAVLVPAFGFERFAQALQALQPAMTVQINRHDGVYLRGPRWLSRGAGFYRLDGEG